MKKELKKKADYLFEISWEVCNQIGGIYTVIKSKAPYIHEFYGDNYFLIGPYFPKEAAIKFEKKSWPNHLKKISNELEKENCYYGKWNINGVKINTILVDSAKLKNVSERIKKQLWEDFRIDTSDADEKFNEFVMWGGAVGILLEKLRKVLKGKIVAHFHEYLSGVPLLYLKKKKIKIATVFTTHATGLGRSIAGHGVNLYEELNKIDSKKEAHKYKIQSKHLLEKACALNAHVFTTVSEITGIEAKHILGKKPDLLVPNGIDMDKLPSLEERAIKHNIFKNNLFEFMRVFFFPYYRFNLENSLIYFISGRYEFRNKGIDVFIEALGELNKKLMKDKNSKTIITFLFIPNKLCSTEYIKYDLLQNKINYEGIEHFVNDSIGGIGDKIIHSIASQKLPTTKQLFDDSFYYQIKKKMLELRKKGNPLLITHNLNDEKNDKVIKALKKAGLNNSSHDKVKIIYYPVYLTGADGLINLSYYDTIMGCHLGIFPSYYEPWGYTPVESGALGVPAITTDLAGFGRYVLKNHKNSGGIYVLKRHNVSKKSIIKKLTGYMYSFSKLDKEERIKEKIEAKYTARLVDWKHMINNYIKAHNLALKKLR